MKVDELYWNCGIRAEANGWHDRFSQVFDEGDSEAQLEHIITKLSLITCEVAEAIEELRSGRGVDETYYSEGDKPEGVPSELADIIIRTMDLAYMLGIDLPEMIEEKLDFNDSRGYKHGKKV